MADKACRWNYCNRSRLLTRAEGNTCGQSAIMTSGNSDFTARLAAQSRKTQPPRNKRTQYNNVKELITTIAILTYLLTGHGQANPSRDSSLLAAGASIFIMITTKARDSGMPEKSIRAILFTLYVPRGFTQAISVFASNIFTTGIHKDRLAIAEFKFG